MIKLLDTDKFSSSGVVVTASSTAAGYSSANVSTPKTNEKWRSTSNDDQWLKFDLGSAQAISMVAFFNCNLSSSATVKVHGHASDLGSSLSSWQGSSTVEETFDGFDTNTAVCLFSSQSLRWWLIAIEDPSNSDSYVELGRVFAGVETSPSNNFNENFNIGHIDNSRILRTEGEHSYVVEKPVIRTFDILFRDLSEADQDTMQSFYENVYRRNPFVVALDPDNEPVEFTRYVTLDSQFEFNYSSNRRADLALRLRETK